MFMRFCTSADYSQCTAPSFAIQYKKMNCISVFQNLKIKKQTEAKYVEAVEQNKWYGVANVILRAA